MSLSSTATSIPSLRHRWPRPLLLAIIIIAIILTNTIFTGPTRDGGGSVSFVAAQYDPTDPLSQFHVFTTVTPISYDQRRLYLDLTISSDRDPIRPYHVLTISPRETVDNIDYTTHFFKDHRIKPTKFTINCYDGRVVPPPTGIDPPPSDPGTPQYGEHLATLEVEIGADDESISSPLNWFKGQDSDQIVTKMTCFGFFDVDILPSSSDAHRVDVVSGSDDEIADGQVSCCSSRDAFTNPLICQHVCTLPPDYLSVQPNCCLVDIGLSLSWGFYSPSDDQTAVESMTAHSYHAISFTRPIFNDTVGSTVRAVVFCEGAKDTVRSCEDNYFMIFIHKMVISASELVIRVIGHGSIQSNSQFLWSKCLLNGFTTLPQVVLENGEVEIHFNYPFSAGLNYFVLCEPLWLEWRPTAMLDFSYRQETMFLISMFHAGNTFGAIQSPGERLSSLLTPSIFNRAIVPNSFLQITAVPYDYYASGLESMLWINFQDPIELPPTFADTFSISLHSPVQSRFQLLIQYPDGTVIWSEPQRVSPDQTQDRPFAFQFNPFQYKSKPMNWFQGQTMIMFMLLPQDDTYDPPSSLTPTSAQITWIYHRCLPAHMMIADSEIVLPVDKRDEIICLDSEMTKDVVFSESSMLDGPLTNITVSFFKNSTHISDNYPSYHRILADGSTIPLVIPADTRPDPILLECPQPNGDGDVKSVIKNSNHPKRFQTLTYPQSSPPPQLTSDQRETFQFARQHYRKRNHYYSPRRGGSRIQKGEDNTSPEQTPPLGSSQSLSQSLSRPLSPPKFLKMFPHSTSTPQFQSASNLDNDLNSDQDFNPKHTNIIPLSDPADDNIPIDTYQPYNYTIDGLINPHHQTDYFTFNITRAASSFEWFLLWFDGPYLFLHGHDMKQNRFDILHCNALEAPRNSSHVPTPFCVTMQLSGDTMDAEKEGGAMSEYGMASVYIVKMAVAARRSYTVTCPKLHLMVRNYSPAFQGLREERDPPHMLKKTVWKQLPPFMGSISIWVTDLFGQRLVSNQLVSIKESAPPPTPPSPLPIGAIFAVVIGSIFGLIMVIIVGCEIYFQKEHNMSFVKHSLQFLRSTPCLSLVSYCCCFCCPAVGTRFRHRTQYQQHDYNSHLNSNPDDDDDDEDRAMIEREDN